MKKHPTAGLLFFSVALILSLVTLTYFWPFLRSNSLSAEAYAAIAGFFSVVVASMALYISWYQIQSTEQSARLSVKPHCLLISVIKNTENIPVGVHFRNNGLGPAIVTEWSFTINGTPVPEQNLAGLNMVLNRYRIANLCAGMLIPPGQSLGANQTERVVYVPIDFALTEMNDGSRVTIANSAMERLMREVNFILRFQSAYGEEQTIMLHESSPDKKSFSA